MTISYTYLTYQPIQFGFGVLCAILYLEESAYSDNRIAARRNGSIEGVEKPEWHLPFCEREMRNETTHIFNRHVHHGCVVGRMCQTMFLSSRQKYRTM
ncbi:MAG: hypothetical protein KAV87_68805 [Desulfobacteraceae bacterium]|nr:hypothetical protein [Desulfobacteraceae bacterium]